MEIPERIKEIDARMIKLQKEKEMVLAEQQAESLKEDVMAAIHHFEDAKQVLVEEVRSNFARFIGSIMRKSEHIDTYSIQCYTPYFNDGDACTYSVNTWGDVNKHDENGEWQKEWNDKDRSVEEELKEFLKSISDDIYKDVFGDHIEVTFRRDGTSDVNKFEHE